MKKIKSIVSILLISIILCSCGQPIKFENKWYPTYGLFNMNGYKSDKMCYEISVGNVVWSIILIETVIFPIYFVGFSLYNPVGVKGTNGCGIDSTN